MDQERIDHHVSQARFRGRAISDDCARMIAAGYAEGMGPTQEFATTGAITVDPSGLWRDFFTLPGGREMYPDMSPADQAAADMLGTYLQAAGMRGPVPGWSRLWISDPEPGTRQGKEAGTA